MTMSFADDKTDALWAGFMPVRKEIRNNIGTALYSMQIYPPGFFNHFNPLAPFEKWAAIEVTDHNTVPDEMESFLLPGGLYAVFLYRGDGSTAAKTFQYIFETWLPASAYLVDNRPHFELLGEKYQRNSASSEEEIWIPITPKE